MPWLALLASVLLPMSAADEIPVGKGSPTCARWCYTKMGELCCLLAKDDADQTCFKDGHEPAPNCRKPDPNAPAPVPPERRAGSAAPAR
ncbi:MAG: hypothetical protein IT285_09435 [Bdellovibrionales bacterium]|nr:hypothetical protein [Bdellovibrionales bacterium]